MSARAEHDREQDVLTSRWEAIPERLEERLAELLLEKIGLASYKCSSNFIAFELTFEDGAVVSFDWENDYGCTFEVTLNSGVTKDVMYHDGDPASFGASIDWVESLAEEPVEYALEVLEIAERRS